MTGWKQRSAGEIAAAENTWTRRSKTYKAKTFAALKELYGFTKPGHEPKGITTTKEVDTNGELGNNMVKST